MSRAVRIAQRRRFPLRKPALERMAEPRRCPSPKTAPLPVSYRLFCGLLASACAYSSRSGGGLDFKSGQAQTCGWCYARGSNPAREVTFAMEPGVIGVIGLLFGSLIAWLALRARSATLSARLSLTEKQLAAQSADLARLQHAHTDVVTAKARLESALESERKTSNEKIELITRAGERAGDDLRNAFKALASDA